jgi:cellobiose phosphorylase
VYHIQAHNLQHVCRGVKRMLVDGVGVNGNLVPVFNEGEHTVEVWLGDIF